LKTFGVAVGKHQDPLGELTALPDPQIGLRVGQGQGREDRNERGGRKEGGGKEGRGVKFDLHCEILRTVYCLRLNLPY